MLQSPSSMIEYNEQTLGKVVTLELHTFFDSNTTIVASF